ncbi:MAG: DUF6311 domain-containing protein, partial [Xanthomonadaceae bacterium]|nr:DUF6311 domain-containing protein [Xanthomonadaceae bacterium]MDP2185913.1 DUF6311 domain-containing protein [Xanthomonadales bacterium]MDZ4116325.1 DUF6311 domain-containing protein [Xanthomonadaceae bacterium]
SARAPALWSIQSPGLLALTHSMLNPGDELDIGKTFKFHQESNTTLAAILLYFSREFSARRWIVLLAVSTLIHAYLLAMVLALYLTDLVQRGSSRQLSVVNALRCTAVAGLSIAAIMWAAGYFMLGADAVSGGFGVYRMNLLSPVDPDDIWSALLPNQDQAPGAYEGFNFLGSGMLVLGLIAVLAAAGNKGPANGRVVTGSSWPLASALLEGSVPRMVPILVLSVLLFGYAISNRVAIGGQELLSYPLPAMAQPLADTFRSSGRFFWPVYYLAYLAIFYLLFTRLSARWAAAICAVALVFQVVDSNAAREWYRTRFARTPEWSSPLRSAMWDVLASRYRKIAVVLPHNASPDWKVLSRFAADHRMAINTGYFARIDRAREQQAGRRVATSIIANRLDADSLYVFQDDGLWKRALSQLQPTDVAGTLDGFRIVAPHLRDCMDCNLEAIATAAKDGGADYRYDPVSIQFTSAERGHAYTVHEWSRCDESSAMMPSPTATGVTNARFCICNGTTSARSDQPLMRFRRQPLRQRRNRQGCRLRDGGHEIVQLTSLLIGGQVSDFLQ